MFARDFDRHTLCPFDNIEDSRGLCVGERCALWHRATDEQFSCCVFESIAHDMSTISYAVSRNR